MYELSKLLLDNKIDQRTFVHRLAQAGISLAGASTIANSLASAEPRKQLSDEFSPRFNSNPYKERMQQTGNNIGVMLDHPDINYVKMDGAYDIESERVDDPKDLQSALLRCKNAMQNGRPYLVNVRI